MFEALTRLFSNPGPAVAPHDPQLAVAALLVHLANADGSVMPEERAAIVRVLQEKYELDEAAVHALVAEATRRDAEAVDFYQFTSALKTLDSQERIEVVRMMWQVVFADAANDELEDNIVWRVAELIGVSARDRTVLRSQMARRHK